jgi:L-aminopeptidase/D-esterase-like protein
MAVGDAKKPECGVGLQACEAASASAPGARWCGAGAAVGKFFTIRMKSGLGTASLKVAGITVGAIVAVNAVGDIIDQDRHADRGADEDGKKLLNTREAILRGELPATLKAGTATTIGVVATDGADQGASAEDRANGTRRPRAGDQSHSHDVRRRHHLRNRHRQIRQDGKP